MAVNRIYRGCIVPQTVEDEVTENGVYPVTGGAVNAAIQSAMETGGLPLVSAADAGKVLTVNAEGKWVAAALSD